MENNETRGKKDKNKTWIALEIWQLKLKLMMKVFTRLKVKRLLIFTNKNGMVNKFE